MKTIAKFLSIAFLMMILGASFSFTACNNQGDKEKAADSTAADTLPKEITLSADAQALLKSFPTPFEVTNMLEKSKAGYIFSVTNPPANVDKYNTEKAKAINLGVYSADLCYSATYKMIDKTNEFMACTKKLSEGLGISGIYKEEMVEKLKKFSNNRDSLVNIISKSFAETNEFLGQNNRNQIAIYVTAGGFAESVYLSAALAEFAKDNSKIMSIIAGQKDNYNKLMGIMQEYNADANVKPITDELTKLKPIWENYGIGSGAKVSAENAKAISDLAEGVRTTLIQ
jgi:hypothetical protein